MEQDLEKLYEDHIHWNSYPASKPWKPTQALKPKYFRAFVAFHDVEAGQNFY